jgi:predicted Zn-dependent peptidase
MSRRALAICAGLLAVLAGPARAHATATDGVRLARFEQATLANGAVLVLMEKRDTPLVSLRAVLRGGALGDPEGKEGSAALLAELLQKGAGKRDAAAFAEAIESAGGELETSAQNETLDLGASFLARDVDLMVELVADALLRPRLDRQEFERVRTLAIQSLTAAKDGDPRHLIDTYGHAWLFRGHPYGRPPEGSEKSLRAISLDDLANYYRAHCGGDRLIITVVGDIRAAEAKRKLEAAFGGWRKAGAEAPHATAMAPVQGRRVLLVDKPGVTQSYFWVGNVGARRTDPARAAQTLANSVFGGRFTSMLNTELRVKSGLSYSAGSAFVRLTEPGPFLITSYTQTDKTAAAIDLALATLDRLHDAGIDSEMLASARGYVLGQFPPTIETNGQLAARLADIVFFGLDRRDVDEFAKRVAAVDAESVRASIERDFPRSTDLAMVVIGDAAEIRAELARYGPVTEMKITDPSFTPPGAN